MLKLFIAPAFVAAALCTTPLAFAQAGAPASPGKTAKGPALVNAHGMTLYTFDKDAGGKSACDGGCAALWPPLTAPAGAAASGKWSIITRPDGSKQWAHDGKPLYAYAHDAKPGDVSGDNFKGVWHIAKP